MSTDSRQSPSIDGYARSAVKERIKMEDKVYHITAVKCTRPSSAHDLVKSAMKHKPIKGRLIHVYLIQKFLL